MQEYIFVWQTGFNPNFMCIMRYPGFAKNWKKISIIMWSLIKQISWWILCVLQARYSARLVWLYPQPSILHNWIHLTLNSFQLDVNIVILLQFQSSQFVTKDLVFLATATGIWTCENLRLYSMERICDHVEFRI